MTVCVCVCVCVYIYIYIYIIISYLRVWHIDEEDQNLARENSVIKSMSPRKSLLCSGNGNHKILMVNLWKTVINMFLSLHTMGVSRRKGKHVTGDDPSFRLTGIHPPYHFSTLHPYHILTLFTVILRFSKNWSPPPAILVLFLLAMIFR